MKKKPTTIGDIAFGTGMLLFLLFLVLISFYACWELFHYDEMRTKQELRDCKVVLNQEISRNLNK